MGSASRESLAKAQALLSGLGKSVTTETGSELLTASAVIAGSSQLRAALADNVVDAKIKQKLVSDVFSSAGKPAQEVLNEIAANRWSHADDVVDAIENLGIRAEAMLAKAPLDDELLAALTVIDSDNDLELSLGSKLGDSSSKGDLAQKIFAGKVSEGAVRVLRHLVQNSRGRRIGSMLKHAASIVADQNGFELATVTVAQPLDTTRMTRLQKSLTASYGRSVKLNVNLDPSLLGGMRIRIGDDVIDGSVSTRLNELRLKLA